RGKCSGERSLTRTRAGRPCLLTKAWWRGEFGGVEPTLHGLEAHATGFPRTLSSDRQEVLIGTSPHLGEVKRILLLRRGRSGGAVDRAGGAQAADDGSFRPAVFAGGPVAGEADAPFRSCPFLEHPSLTDTGTAEGGANPRFVAPIEAVGMDDFVENIRHVFLK